MIPSKIIRPAHFKPRYTLTELAKRQNACPKKGRKDKQETCWGTNVNEKDPENIFFLDRVFGAGGGTLLDGHCSRPASQGAKDVCVRTLSGPCP